MLGSVFRLDGKGSCVPIEAGECALGSLQATLTNMVDLQGDLIASLNRIVHNHFTAFPYPVECVRARHLSAVDRSPPHKTKRVFSTIYRLHHDGLGRAVDLLNRHFLYGLSARPIQYT